MTCPKSSRDMTQNCQTGGWAHTELLHRDCGSWGDQILERRVCAERRFVKKSSLGTKFKISAEEGSWRSGVGVREMPGEWSGTRALKPETTLTLGSCTAQVDRTFQPPWNTQTSIHKRCEWFEEGHAKKWVLSNCLLNLCLNLCLQESYMEKIC